MSKAQSDKEKTANNTQVKQDGVEGEEEAEIAPISLDILSIVQTAQNQNGLRHDDYMRYRRYCSRKIHRLRKTTKLTCGRGKFQKRAVALEDVADVRHLMIVLFTAERNWSYAMDLKHEFTELTPDNTRLKYHIKRKMTKACEAAKLLFELAHETGNKRTSLETEGYFRWMKGNLASEEGQWEEGLKNFEQSKVIFTELSKIADSLETFVFSSKLEQIETFVRYCQYNLHGAFADPSAVKDLTSGQLGPYTEALKSRVEALLSEEKGQKGVDGMKIEFNGQSLTVKNEKARVSLQLAEESLRASQSTENFKEKLSAHVNILNNLEEASRHITNEKKDANIDGTSSASNYYNMLLQYVQYKKHLAMLERAAVTITNSNAAFAKDNEFDLVLKGGKPKHTKPKDVVKTIDSALQHISRILDHLDDTKEGDKCSTLKVKAQVYNVWRCKYVALSYAFDMRMREASALLTRCGEKATSAIKTVKGSTLADKDDVVSQLNELASSLTNLQCKIQARFAMQRFLENNPDYAEKKQREADASNKKKKKAGKATQVSTTYDFSLVETNPSLEAMPAKPIIFDLVWNRLDFPDLTERVKPKASGLLNKLGWGKLWGS